jgi:hypothetical protein
MPLGGANAGGISTFRVVAGDRAFTSTGRWALAGTALTHSNRAQMSPRSFPVAGFDPLRIIEL